MVRMTGGSQGDRRWSAEPGVAEIPLVGGRLLEVGQLLGEGPVPVLLPEPAVPGALERLLLQVHVHLLTLRIIEDRSGIVERLVPLFVVQMGDVKRPG